jgi:hypothetical protein
MKRDRALEAIRDWLTVRPDSEYDVLFTSLDHNTLGESFVGSWESGWGAL